MKKPLIVLLVVAVAVGAYLVLKPKKDGGPEASSSPSPSGAAGVKGSKTPEPQVQGGTNPSPKTYQVIMSESTFATASLTVKKGDKVTFSNQGSQSQTVTADNGAFTSGSIIAGGNYTLDTTNLAAGTYAYHSSQPSMKATLIVQ